MVSAPPAINPYHVPVSAASHWARRPLHGVHVLYGEGGGKGVEGVARWYGLERCVSWKVICCSSSLYSADHSAKKKKRMSRLVGEVRVGEGEGEGWVR